jgi:hypothetical protein
VIALMPPPEPIGPYVTLRPRLESTFGVQAETSGATKELPAPVRDPAVDFAPAPVVSVNAAPIAARTATVLRVKVSPLVFGSRHDEGARPPPRRGKSLGEGVVTGW